MDQWLPIHDPANVVRALARVHCVARQSRLSEEDLTSLLSAAVAGAARALQSGAQLGLRVDSRIELRLLKNDTAEDLLFSLPAPPGSDPDLPAEDDCPAALETVARILHANNGAGTALQASRKMIASLETELEETNRGVMALYAELDDRADKLRRADELKSRFLSYASHELRTPLNGIVGLVRLLRSANTPRSEDDLKQLAFIQRAAEEMREMVNDLLDLAKVEAGKVTIEPSEFDLDFVFGALRGIFRPLLQTEDVTLTFEDTSAVPSIYSDEAKVSQILRNLLSNALKFTERGGVRVWAIAESDAVRIMVGDTGIGIPPDQIGLIFDEFTQVDSPLQRRVRGTGLGLPLCKKLAALLGGDLSVESLLGHGSTFTLRLPRVAPVAHAGTAKASKRTRERPTVLIVDDMEIDRYLLSHLITASGDYDIIQAEDGHKGLEVARRERPDLIFLDLNLPVMDGFLVAAELQTDPETRGIPVFAVTAETLDEAEIARLRELTRGVILKEQLSEARCLNIHLAEPVEVKLG